METSSFTSFCHRALAKLGGLDGHSGIPQIDNIYTDGVSEDGPVEEDMVVVSSVVVLSVLLVGFYLYKRSQKKKKKGSF